MNPIILIAFLSRHRFNIDPYYTDIIDLIIGKLVRSASIMVHDAVQAFFLLLIVNYEMSPAKTDYTAGIACSSHTVDLH